MAHVQSMIEGALTDLLGDAVLILLFLGCIVWIKHVVRSHFHHSGNAGS